MKTKINILIKANSKMTKTTKTENKMALFSTKADVANKPINNLN